MSTAVAIIDAGMIALISRECPEAMPYALRLATNADAAGNLIDSRALAAVALGKSERTISRYRAALSRIGYLIRYSGGNRGECVRMVIKRFANDASAFVARRAMAAVWLAGKERIAALALARRKRQARPRAPGDPLPLGDVLGKGDMNVTRLTSLGGEGAGIAQPADPRHVFIAGELLGICSRCELPEANARHRKGKNPQGWTNTRPA